MKKFLLASLALIFVLSSAAIAEVQNVKVGGEIRVRGYYEDNRTDLSTENKFPGARPDDAWQYRWNPRDEQIPNDTLSAQHWSDTDSYILQRTQVYVEADLTDNVLVRVTLEANGAWGSTDGDNNPNSPLRGGTENWDAGIVEAWLQVSELYYSPLTLKVGRQYLNYGTGFMISDKEKFWNFDAVKAVLDFYPWTLDLIYAKLAENTDREFQVANSATAAIFDTRRDWDLYGANLRYSADFWNIEAYVFGTQNTTDTSHYANSALRTAYTSYTNGVGWANVQGRLVPSDLAPSVVGIRGDVRPVEQLDIWGEFTYEFGNRGAIARWATDNDRTIQNPLEEANEIDLEAYAVDCGLTYTFDWTWEPAITLAYTFASGSSDNVTEETDSAGNRIRSWDKKSHAFYPLFDYDYYGYAFSPMLSNIHIFNAGLSVLPLENVEVVLDYYHYEQDKNNQCELGASAGLYPVVGNPFMDNGGVSAPTNGKEKSLGDEIDVTINYDYSEDVSVQLIAAYFIPGGAFDNVTEEKEMIEVRGELKVNF
ncbi:MAG: alginate export family protein [Candidatus Aureabacteria bacterium]|nr:alginate export family protein [Candidatus Auribacterota bacterium]